MRIDLTEEGTKLTLLPSLLSFPIPFLPLSFHLQMVASCSKPWRASPQNGRPLPRLLLEKTPKLPPLFLLSPPFFRRLERSCHILSPLISPLLLILPLLRPLLSFLTRSSSFRSAKSPRVVFSFSFFFPKARPRTREQRRSSRKVDRGRKGRKGLQGPEERERTTKNTRTRKK
jgi:hypothetical protein